MSRQQRDKEKSVELNSTADPYGPMTYQIRIKGHLRCQWVDWLGGMTISLEENGNTVLTGSLVDQAALFGLLKKVRDLGLPLISVNQTNESLNPIDLDEKGALNK